MTDDNNEITQDNDGILAMFEDDEEDKEDKEEVDDEDDEDDNINELDTLSKDEQKWVLEETTAVCNAVTKVSGKCLPFHC